MPNTMVATTVRTTQIQLRLKEMTLSFFDVRAIVPVGAGPGPGAAGAAGVVTSLAFSLWLWLSVSGWELDVGFGGSVAFSLT